MRSTSRLLRLRRLVDEITTMTTTSAFLTQLLPARNPGMSKWTVLDLTCASIQIQSWRIRNRPDTRKWIDPYLTCVSGANGSVEMAYRGCMSTARYTSKGDQRRGYTLVYLLLVRSGRWTREMADEPSQDAAMRWRVRRGLILSR